MNQSVKTEQNRKRPSFGELLRSGDYDYAQPKTGEVREAVILSIGERDIVVDIAGKRDGIIPPKDLSMVDREYVESLQVGDRIPVVVMRKRLYEEGIRVSLNRGLQQQDWLRAEELLESSEIVQALVVDHNRGGILVEFGKLRGFVPNSHLGRLSSGHRAGRLQEAKPEMVGKTLPLAVIEVNPRRRRLVLSKRAVERRLRRQLLEELEPGQTRTGTVSNLVDFGAFVDLGGVDGLVHISELDWVHVDHPSEVLSVGDEIQVYVLNVEPERQRISLSRKRLLPNPWDEVTAGLEAGDVVTGTVSNIVSFGVFVDLGKGVEGLVHESKLPRGSTTAHPEIVRQAGITVKVLHIDHEKRQIGLQMVMPTIENASLPDIPIDGDPYAQASPDNDRRADMAFGG